MPSPFPGMDPYLESPRFFPDLHAGLIFAMKAELQGRLSQAYYAQSGQRVWLEVSGGPASAARLTGGVQPRLRRRPLPQGHLVRQRPNRSPIGF